MTLLSVFYAESPKGTYAVTPEIEKMLLLQDHDLRIIRLEKELGDAPKRKQAIDALLDDHRQALAKAKEELKARQSDIKQAELDVEGSREKVRKYRGQQIQLKSNQEFRAMEGEIAGVEKTIRQLEDRMIEMMETIEAAQNAVKERDTALKTEEVSVKREIEAIDQRAREVQTELDQARQARTALAVGLEAARLQHYERIMKNKREKALVPVEHGACGSCHMKLPPYQVHDARNQTGIVVCEYCGRMLY